MKKKLDLHLYTNEDCNIQCKHCYNDSKVKKDKKEIALEKINDIIKELYESYDLDIHLEGGEIFLRSNIFKTLAELDKDILNCVTITSNGTIFMDTPEVKHVVKNINNLRISVEGHTNELNNCLRNCNLFKVLDNAKKYQNMGANIVLRMTLHKHNIETIIEETLPSLANRGFNSFQIYELQAVGRGESLDYCIKNEKDFSAFLDSLVSYTPKESELKVMFNENRIESIELRKDELTTHGVRVKNIESSLSLSIKTNGDVSICPWDSDGEVLLNIHKDASLVRSLEELNLVHDCKYCSKIKLEVG